MGLQQTMETAIAHHKAGRVHEAEGLYRQALADAPNHPEVLHLLGVAALQTGRLEEGAGLIARALTGNPSNASYHCNFGTALNGLGKRDEAIAAFRESLRLNPSDAETHYNLANTFKAKGDHAQAITAYREALKLNPQLVQAMANLGIALREQGQLDEAIACLHRAVQMNPMLAEGYSNLGAALKDQGKLDEAIMALQSAVRVRPGSAQGYSNLSACLRAKGQPEEAVAASREAVRINPADAEAHHNLGLALGDMDLTDDAISSCAEAVRLKADHVGALNSLSIFMRGAGRLDESVAACRQALKIDPERAETYANLGAALRLLGKLDDAIEAYDEALRREPSLVSAHTYLAVALHMAARHDEALRHLETALTLRPSAAATASSRIMMLHYHPASTRQTIVRESHLWNDRYAAPRARFIQPHANDRDPERRLRIGYVSADFCAHASAYFLDPLLRSHDHGQFEIHCYSNVTRPDGLTDEFKKIVDRWHRASGLSDVELAEQIRRDRIDILVDLKQHTEFNRLLTFARKPAPVQVSWLGYPGSSGVAAIDYRLSDPYLDPPEADASGETEKCIRLPDCFWCFNPLTAEPAVNELPALRSGHINFACLNRSEKLNDEILKIWARLLGACPGSTLLLYAPQGSARRHVVNLMDGAGVAAERIAFAEPMPRQAYLELYHRVDIALDPFPYNGHTTTLDGLWMGVPSVSLAGSMGVSRGGLSILSNLGLGALAAESAEDYVRIAADWAADFGRLAELRRTLRERMRVSALMDAKRFARNVEDAYRLMWREWCAGRPDAIVVTP